ncbi:MAG TPA: nuclear transport factor 2 family protein, partial [Gillisia sp.]|nr:nuclear transport factor 2 family protein [Gillisia sp.]
MNKAKRQLLDKTFNTFMNVGLGQENLDLLKDIVAKDVVGFGTAIDEKIFGLKELFELLKRQKEQSAGMEVSWKINTLDIHISNDENTAIFTNDLKFYITVDGNPIDMYMRISVVLEYTEAKWLVVHWHGSKPELVESEKDTWGIETWKEKAEALEKEVAERTADLVEKNWELKVEAALERVRAVTMGIKKPEDLLEVCRVISDQLVEFEVKKIRNVQIAIIDEIIGQYLCYQYFTPYKKTAVEKTEYLKSPVEHEMVRQMLASRDGYFIGRLSGNELEEFREHRKAENHLPDPFLDEAAELAYCFLSIGEGGLGLTLYQPMEEEILALFRRFHQVFLLAYQRFRDIQKAETQAREAQIELALERVRAKAMAMQDPTHFEEVIKVMGEQFIQLDFDIEWVNFGANGLDVSNGIDTWNFAVIPGGNPISSRFFIPYIDHSLFLEAVGQLDNYRRTGNDFFEISCGKEDKDLWLDHLFTTRIFKNIPEEFKAIQYAKPGYTTSNIALKDTWLSIGKFDKRSFTNEQHVILRKFANAFGQAYTRFLDLQKAEAQAKEAQIETSLERVRSAALAMHRSDDLRISLQKLFEELDKLELGMIRCGIAILDPSKPSADVWIMAKSGDNNSIQLSGDNNSIQLSGNEPLESNFMLLKAYQAWKKGNDYEYILEGSELTEYYHSLDKINFLSNLKSTFSEEIKTPRQHYFNAAFKHGSLFAFFEDQMPDYGKTILKRFSNVLNLAYSRFSDIQIAEAQAREAQIEAALERVRSRSMAMHKSEELLDVISVVSEQLKQLNFKFVHVSFANNDSTQDYKFWTSARGKSKPLRFNVPYLDIAVFNNLREAQEKSVTFYTDILTKEEHIQWHKHLLNHGGANVFSKEENEFIMSRGMARSIAINPNIILILANYAMIPYSDEENKIIERFGLVFEQSYTRFLD